MITFFNKIWKEDGRPVNYKIFLTVLGPAILILLGLNFYLFGDRYVSTDNAYVKANKTSISAEITGKVEKVHVKNNGLAKKGDVLFSIDPEPFEIAHRQAQANVGIIKIRIESLRADYLQKVSEYEKVLEKLKFQESENKRYKELLSKGNVSKEKADQVRLDYQIALKQRNSAEQDVESAKAKVAGNFEGSIEDNPDYQEALALEQKAALDLARVNVEAPADGIVANMNLEPGEFTATGLPLFALINDKGTWVEANFKETDLTYVKPGQKVEVEVDTYPGIKWKAKVVSISPATGSEFSILPAQNSSGNWVKVVQRIMVRIELEPNQENKPILRSGMSAYVTIDTGSTRLFRFFSHQPYPTS